MIWRLEHVDTTFIDAFESAGDPDQAVIDAYVAQHGLGGPQKHTNVKRWYYLLKGNPRIRLSTIGMPLDAWLGEAKVLVGTGEIIGEFKGNREYVGQTGLKLQMEPIAWLRGQADVHYTTGHALLDTISEQVLDRKAIEHVQTAITQKYRHRPLRRKQP